MTCLIYVIYAVLVLCLVKVLEWLIRSVPVSELQKKYIVITGCDSGFGNLLAKKLDQKGIHVIACCYTSEGLKELEKNTSDKLRTLHLDVSSHESVEDCYQAVKKMLPPDTGLWGLVNNAGVTGFSGPLDWCDIHSYTKIVRVNLLGVVDMTLTFLPLIYKAGGRVVNISSSYGRFPMISGGYSEAKFGVESFTDSLRMHFMSIGSKCKVSVLEPGHFHTAVTDLSAFRKTLIERYSASRREVKDFYPSDWKAYVNRGWRLQHLLKALFSRHLYFVSRDCDHGDWNGKGLAIGHILFGRKSIWSLSMCMLPSIYALNSLDSKNKMTCLMYTVYIVLALFLTKLLEWLIRSFPVSQLQDKYIVITGCDSGFGNLLAKKLDQKGVHVIACCYTPEGLKELEKNTSDKLRTLHLDVSSHESVEDCYQAVKKILPHDTRLWGLVNNAGIGGFTGPLDWCDIHSYTKIVKVNLLGVVDMTLTFLPLIYKAGGRVVNISSSYGRTATEFSTLMHFISIGSPCKVSVLNPAHFLTGISQGVTYRDTLMERYSTCRPEVKAFYPSDWKAYIDKVADANLNFKNVLRSPRLDPVVDAYIHALISRWPKKRYTIGWDAYLIWVPFSYLPSCVTDPVICHLINSGRRI
ncbi:Retinol dehydrogenase 7 [Holothuria leucospilota]|uniref:Retinol dehydrogenase 7 n=1 Tax=Holothuria leucospilota TaxID=206669 RepID=A0A9Q1BFC7_HOLLE|nr:Retinol dehydrogenase 7 [Holothuria leucospilota]